MDHICHDRQRCFEDSWSPVPRHIRHPQLWGGFAWTVFVADQGGKKVTKWSHPLSSTQKLLNQERQEVPNRRGIRKSWCEGGGTFGDVAELGFLTKAFLQLGKRLEDVAKVATERHAADIAPLRAQLEFCTVKRPLRYRFCRKNNGRLVLQWTEPNLPMFWHLSCSFWRKNCKCSWLTFKRVRCFNDGWIIQVSIEGARRVWYQTVRRWRQNSKPRPGVQCYDCHAWGWSR